MARLVTEVNDQAQQQVVSSQAEDLDPRRHELMLCDVLINEATYLAAFQDPEPFIPRTFKPIREQAADIVRALALVKGRISSEHKSRWDVNRWDLDESQSSRYREELNELTPTVRDIAMQLHALLSNAVDVADKNDEAAQEYARCADFPSDNLDLTSFEEKLRSLGIVPLAQNE